MSWLASYAHLSFVLPLAIDNINWNSSLSCCKGLFEYRLALASNTIKVIPESGPVQELCEYCVLRVLFQAQVKSSFSTDTVTALFGHFICILVKKPKTLCSDLIILDLYASPRHMSNCQSHGFQPPSDGYGREHGPPALHRGTTLRGTLPQDLGGQRTCRSFTSRADCECS